jgi:dipeptidyl aminopeptidase/acylaminoacyl peptidase
MATSFDSLPTFLSLPRIEGLALSPDGTRAILTIATLKSDQTGFDRSLWELVTDGSGHARRLTRSAKGESAPAYTAEGDVLFVSGRPDSDASDDNEAAQLWLLPAAGGEARAVTRLAGGVSGVSAVAQSGSRIIVAADLMPSAGLVPGVTALEGDAKVRAARKKHKVSAILHETYPVRYWDHDLGPDEPHLLVLDLDELRDTVGAVRDESAADAETDAADDAAPTPYPATLPRPGDLTPSPGRSADAAGVSLTPDGSTVIAALRVAEGRDARWRLVSIDTATAEHTVIRDEPGVDLEQPTISHDGASVAYIRTVKSTPAAPSQQELWVSRIDGTDARRVAPHWDRWPSSIVFDRDDDALLVTADQNGRGPLFRIPLGDQSLGDPSQGDGSPQQLTHDDFTYTHVAVDRGTGDVVALRSNWMMPPHPVRVTREGTTTDLGGPVALPDVPATMTEIETTADDGARVRGWLLLPEGATAQTPAPLLLWIHGGPLNSWNAWSWRWNPQLAVARGYAVLLPDPALSTGYGLDFIARGWNAWGAAPYTDLLAITDETIARPDIDQTRTAAMGGSFGGYMANWIAGHTDRFRAIVTHASLWSLDQFGPTTDFSPYWQSIFTPEGMIENSPHRFVSDIRSPMLVIHGDRDYRVPIGEGLRLWSELGEHFADPDGTMPHRFLYFPDENHWVLAPQHAVIWYETVFAFLAQHVLGEPWSRPDNLG